MRTVVAIAGICAALGLAACGEDDDEPSAAPSEEATQAAADAKQDEQDSGAADGGQREEAADKPGVEIATGDSQFGTVLFDGDDQPIYYFDKEASSVSQCYGACAEAWPPVLSDGEPRATGEVESKLLGTTRRDDGSTQVTYHGRPLYYYVDDPPGEVRCHNVVEFGGTWLAIQPSGDPVA